jgi:DNA mismatch repair protein MutS2
VIKIENVEGDAENATTSRLDVEILSLFHETFAVVDEGEKGDGGLHEERTVRRMETFEPSRCAEEHSRRAPRPAKPPPVAVLAHPCPPKTASDLDWPKVLGALADRCVSPLGKDRALTLPFPDTREATRTALAESAEAVGQHNAHEPLPVFDVPDVRAAAGRLRAHGVLAPDELRALAATLAAARTLRRFLTSRKAKLPALYAACATDPTLDDVEDELTRAFDPDGTLADKASARLRELRAEQATARARMLSRLDDLMNRYEPILQDRFVTEREGRYVIPVRSDAHERFPGIVHATSGSGSTIFVEPRAVVPMGNRLKMLEADVAREEIAIYTRLSSLVADVLPSVEGALAAIARADVCAATAKLAEDLALTFPAIDDTPTLDLRDARHPLLVLDSCGPGKGGRIDAAGTIIPSDVAVASGKGMVVSGPNAGGKTALLKTMGLAALMTRAGLPVACTGGSIGLFDVVLTDVGDDQNLAKNLSTFSAHVRNLAHILDETRPGALVLLDELAGGTDPREGEALAAGVLDSLAARGGAVAATTHYEGLKALALGDARFVNASVGVDLATMTPTFKLAIGVPGSSSALAVAARFGMPKTVIERAERFLSREDQNFESLVKKLNAERAALELARQAAETREAEAAANGARLEAEILAAKDREGRIVSREAEALLASLRRAKDDLRAAQAKLRTKKIDDSAVREAARAIDRVAGQATLGGELESVTMRKDETPRATVRAEELKRGSRVYVPRLRAEADVLELLSGGSVRVAVGPLKLVVTAEELRAAEPASVPPSLEAKHARVDGTSAATPRRGQNVGAPGPQSFEVPVQTTDNTVDVRGLRADDAVSMATTFLDRSLNAGRRVAYVIHGHGTGALRDAIRKDLAESPYVAQFRAGESGEGGDGVTVVWLA